MINYRLLNGVLEIIFSLILINKLNTRLVYLFNSYRKLDKGTIAVNTDRQLRITLELFRSLDSSLPAADQLIYSALTKMRIKDPKSIQMEVELVYDLDNQNDRFNNFYQVTENLSFKNLGKNFSKTVIQKIPFLLSFQK